VDYIFTEFTVEIYKYYINLYAIMLTISYNITEVFSLILPFVVKSFIGYCHFYYQLGYGLVFYIYIFRRYKAKKNKNWKHFYGNSIINWLIFNFSIFNKFVLNKNYIIFIKTHLSSTIIIIKFLVDRLESITVFYKKVKKLHKSIFLTSIKYVWTPVFKKSSYISFLTFLKRFGKRK